MPGFSGLKSGLVSTCSGTSLQPTLGISSHCLRTDRASCSSWFLRLSMDWKKASLKFYTFQMTSLPCYMTIKLKFQYPGKHDFDTTLSNCRRTIFTKGVRIKKIFSKKKIDWMRHVVAHSLPLKSCSFMATKTILLFLMYLYHHTQDFFCLNQ